MKHRYFNAFKIFLIFLTLVFFSHGGSLNSGFMFDDFNFIDKKHTDIFKKPADYFTKTKSQHYNPFYYLINSYIFEHWGPSPIIYHIHNLIVFTILCFLLYIFVKTLFNNHLLAILTSALFCVHPINHSFIAYITLNSTMYMGIFSFISAIIFLFWLKNKNRKSLYIFSMTSYIISLLFQDFNLTFPAYLLLILIFTEKHSVKKSIMLLFPFFIISAAYLFIWCIIGGTNAGLIEKIKLLNMPWSIYISSFSELSGWYLTNLLFPLNVVLIFNIPPAPSNILTNYAAFALILIMIIVIKHKSLVTDNVKLSISWLLLGFIPLNLLLFAHAYMGVVIEPYWFFISSFGFFLLWALGIQKLKSFLSKTSYKIIILSIFTYLTALSWHYSFLWKNEKTYSQYWLSVCPNNTVALMALYKNAVQEKNYDQALNVLNTVLKQVHYDPHIVFSNIALIHYNKKNYTDAKEYALKAINANPNYANAFNVLGIIFVKENNLTQAEKMFKKAIELDSFFVLAKLNLADVYVLENNREKAKELLEEIIEKDRNKEALFLYQSLTNNKISK